MRRLPQNGEAAPMRQVLLLAACGLAFAVQIMVSKAALDAGANAFQLGVVGNFGAGSVLLVWLLARGDRVSTRGHDLALYLMLGIVSVAIPTVLSFFVVQRVGPAYAATVYALSPLLTMGFAAGFGIEPMTFGRSVGIGVGLLGMLTLLQQRVAAIDLAQTTWVFVGLCIPACAALGNVTRSAFWPKGVSAPAFACATLFTSSMVMAALSPLFAAPRQWRFDEPVLLWLGAFVLASASSYVLNFRLQSIAGPVVLSQIGYWGTGFGIVLAACLFGDVITGVSLVGLAALVTGGLLASRHRG